MLGILRESLLARLAQASPLVDLYRTGDSEFVARVIQWLESTEAELLKLRSPLASLCSSERARLLATADGFRDGQLSEAERRPRRAARATAALSLSRVVDAFRAKITEIDSRLDQLREKLAQMIALGSAAGVLALQPIEPRAVWFHLFWDNLGTVAEGQALFTYLSAQLGPTDREYLLNEILDNGVLGNPPSA